MATTFHTPALHICTVLPPSSILLRSFSSIEKRCDPRGDLRRLFVHPLPICGAVANLDANEAGQQNSVHLCATKGLTCQQTPPHEQQSGPLPLWPALWSHSIKLRQTSNECSWKVQSIHCSRSLLIYSYEATLAAGAVLVFGPARFALYTNRCCTPCTSGSPLFIVLCCPASSVAPYSSQLMLLGVHSKGKLLSSVAAILACNLLHGFQGAHNFR
jgi:hypothetical protein